MFCLLLVIQLQPALSRDYAKKSYGSVKRKIRQAITFSLGLGIPVTILFILFPEFFLQFMYHTTEGATYMRVLAPICLFQYIQAPLSSALDAMGRSRDVMVSSFLGMMIRTVLLFLVSLLKIGLWGLIIAIGINVVVVTFHNAKKVKEAL